MSTTIYVPFNDGELAHGARHYYVAGGSTVVLDGSGDTLQHMSSDDILYIFAHGRLSTPTEITGAVKGYLYGTRKATMTAKALADRLVALSLPRQIRDVRLLVCFAGYVGDSIPWTDKHDLKRKKSEAPFAGLLCSAMKDTFKNVMVTGYTGGVGYIPPNHGNFESSLLMNSKGGGEFRAVERLGTRLTQDTLRIDAGRTFWH
jgi:hypothetical protein